MPQACRHIGCFCAVAIARPGVILLRQLNCFRWVTTPRGVSLRNSARRNTISHTACIPTRPSPPASSMRTLAQSWRDVISLGGIGSALTVMAAPDNISARCFMLFLSLVVLYAKRLGFGDVKLFTGLEVLHDDCPS